MLHESKIDVVVVNPARIRGLVKRHRFLKKSDKFDARELQLYGKQVNVSLAKPRTLQERNFIALMKHLTRGSREGAHRVLYMASLLSHKRTNRSRSVT